MLEALERLKVVPEAGPLQRVERAETYNRENNLTVLVMNVSGIASISQDSIYSSVETGNFKEEKVDNSSIDRGSRDDHCPGWDDFVQGMICRREYLPVVVQMVRWLESLFLETIIQL